MKMLVCPCGLKRIYLRKDDLADVLIEKADHDQICKKGPSILIVE